TRFCTKGDGFQFLAKSAILPQNANSQKILESLHTQRGIIPESYLDELLDYEAIDKDKGALLMEWSPPISCATVGR
ncbi:hypothetical protein LVW15_27180, partial [Klebsiella pneumoniae]|nr:hypothetical protein [Klebsiella pneumoniae]